MNKLTFTQEFKRRVKPLSKKYHTLKDSINKLGEVLINNPFIGNSYGNNLYKIRLSDESKGKGKSGGFRVFYYLVIPHDDDIEIVLITIYNKSELDTIKKKDAEKLLLRVLAESGF